MKIVRESLDFERTGSPFEKMGIGKKESDLLFVKEHEWDLSLPHIFKDFIIEELIKNFNNIPILILKSKTKIPTYVAISTDYHSDHKDTPKEALAELKLDLFGIKESLKFTREGSNLEKMGIGKTAIIKNILYQLCNFRFDSFQSAPTAFKKEIQNIKSIPENLKDLNEKNSTLLSKDDFLDLYKNKLEYKLYLDEILERISNLNPKKFIYHESLNLWTEVFLDLNKLDLLLNSPYNWITEDNIHILMDYKEKKTIEKIKELDSNKIFSICSQKNWYPELILYAIDHGANNLNIGSNEAIRKACETGDLLIAEKLLKDPSVDPTQNTPDGKRYKQDEANFCIRRAAKNGHLDIVKLLLKDGRSDPSYRNNFALSAAITNRDKPMMDLLLSDNRVKEKIKFMPKTKQDELRFMKLVKESLSFEKNKNPFTSLNIGIINKIQNFMEDLKKEFQGSHWGWKINPDHSIDIFWPKPYDSRNPIFDISVDEYSLLPSYIKFNKIEGDFACSFNAKESLKSFPKFIKGNCEIFGKKLKEFDESDIQSICKIEKDLKIKR